MLGILDLLNLADLTPDNDLLLDAGYSTDSEAGDAYLEELCHSPLTTLEPMPIEMDLEHDGLRIYESNEIQAVEDQLAGSSPKEPLAGPGMVLNSHDQAFLSPIEPTARHPSYTREQFISIDELLPDSENFWNLFDIKSFDRLVYPETFQEANGIVTDPSTGFIVIGDVAVDINFVDGQTEASCALMCQEQFVHRAIGRSVPEEYLEWQAAEWGVYDPISGTNSLGQVKILDFFHIDYSRHTNCSVEDLDSIIDHECDAMIGVEARYFYEDPTIPEGSGHAIAVVGKAINPASGETAGFYVTDSNYPGSARFMTKEDISRCWMHEIVAIPNQKLA